MFPIELLFLATAALAAPILPRSANGPVVPTNFQDPSVLKVGNTYYGYAGPNGNNAGISSNVITATSNDFETWAVNDADALPNPGAWAASPPHVWAPDVVSLDNGKYVMYYSAITIQNSFQHCVGAAISNSPAGPFTPLDQPLYCDLGAGGAIDPDGFKDPNTGKQYVIYKVDGNSVGHGGSCKNTVAPIVATPILLQEVSPDDGVTPVAAAIQLISNDAADGPVVEAPTLAYDPSTKQYILFFTSGCFTTSTYNIQYATAQNIAGPYTRHGMFLKTGDTVANVQIPGSPDIEPTTNQLVFHGDVNMGWFADPKQGLRTRAMYATKNWNAQGAVKMVSLE